MLENWPLDRLNTDNASEVILALRGISHLDNTSQIPLLVDLNFNIYPNNIYFIRAENISERNAFISLVSGRLKPDLGSVYNKANLKLSYISSTESAFENLSLIDILHLSSDNSFSRDQVELLLSELNIAGKSENRYRELNKANKQKFCWIKALINTPDILIANEMLSFCSLFDQLKIFDFIRLQMKKKSISIICSGESMEVNKHIKSESLIIKDGAIKFRASI